MNSDDLLFLQFLSYIYTNRTKNSNGMLEELSDWLRENNKINSNSDPCEPVHLGLSWPDASRLVDALNTYSPDFPINMVLESPHCVVSRLNISSPSTYTYSSNVAVDIPFFHGGIVEVIGDVNFDSVIDLISSDPSTFTTEIRSSGILVGCNLESVTLAVKGLRDAIYRTEMIHGFQISGRVMESFEIDPVYVRNWVIGFNYGELSSLTVSRVF